MPKKPRAPGAPYTVGYCQTPVGTRFKKGQSGNRRGRPRKAKSTADVPPGLDPLSEATLRILTEEVPMYVAGQNRRVPASEGILRAQLQRALEGDVRSARYLQEKMEEAQAKAAKVKALSDDDGLIEALHAVVKAMRAAKSLGYESVDAYLHSAHEALATSSDARGARQPRVVSEADPVDEAPEADAEPVAETPEMRDDADEDEAPQWVLSGESGESAGVGARDATSPPVDPPPISASERRSRPLSRTSAEWSGHGYGVGGGPRLKPGQGIFK